MLKQIGILAGLILAGLLAQGAHAADTSQYGKVTKGAGWVYTRLGNQNDVATQTTGGVLFEGGGTDVDKAYEWMCQHANGGDFLVIRARATADYNPYIMKLCPGINSVSTLKIETRAAAFDPFVAATIAKAEALFIAGGDQSHYVRYWQNTPVNDGVNALAANGVTIGGTSAGNAILAQYAFSALVGSVYSPQALRDPFNFRMTIDNGFLSLSPVVTGAIADDHFVTRDRMGRLVAFLARISHDNTGAPRPFGIAVDEHTAFLMETNGIGKIVGSSTAYFVSTPGAPEICQPGVRLTYQNLRVYRVTVGNTFDVVNWKGSGGTAYQLSAIKGRLMSTQPGGGVY